MAVPNLEVLYEDGKVCGKVHVTKDEDLFMNHGVSERVIREYVAEKNCDVLSMRVGAGVYVINDSYFKDGKKHCVLRVYTVGKDPGICISGKDGNLKCGLQMDSFDFKNVAKYFPKIARAYRELVEYNQQYSKYFDYLVDRIVIDEGISESPSVAASMVWRWTGCEINFNKKWLENASASEVKRVLAHELGHCVEYYSREVNGDHPSYTMRGEWVVKNGELVPVGSELRARKFDRRVMKGRSRKVEGQASTLLRNDFFMSSR